MCIRDSVQPPPKRQRTSGSYVTKKVIPEQKKQIHEDLLNLLILDFQRFHVVEDAGFRSLMKWIPGYELPNRKTISSVMIPALYHKQVSLVKQTASTEPSSVSITIFLWFFHLQNS